MFFFLLVQVRFCLFRCDQSDLESYVWSVPNLNDPIVVVLKIWFLTLFVLDLFFF